MTWFSFFSSLVAGFLVVGCGTNVKVYDQGDVDLKRIENGRAEAPVLLVYKVNVSKEHQLFFWDQDKNRFNLKIPADTDTTKGILVYLPADRNYALSGFLYLNNGVWHELPFGTELPLFKVKASQVTQIPYFELTIIFGRGQFHVKKSDPAAQEVYLRPVRKNFKLSGSINSVNAL